VRLRVDQGCLVAKSHLARWFSGMDAVDKVKKGADEDNGAVTVPGKIVKMQLAGDAASGKK
jgi:hypothetical protein